MIPKEETTNKKVEIILDPTFKNSWRGQDSSGNPIEGMVILNGVERTSVKKDDGTWEILNEVDIAPHSMTDADRINPANGLITGIDDPAGVPAYSYFMFNNSAAYASIRTQVETYAVDNRLVDIPQQGE